MGFLGALRTEAVSLLESVSKVAGGYAAGVAKAVPQMSENASQIFKTLVEQNREALKGIPQESILGFHRTSPENAINILKTQEFISRRGGLHYGENPQANQSFGPSILMVTKRGGQLHEQVFSKDNKKIFPSEFENVSFTPYRYDDSAENGMRFKPGYEDFEQTFYGD